MNRDTSSCPSGISISSSSSNGLIRAPAPIVSLREAPENKSGLLSDISSSFLEYDVDHLHDTYHIPREFFRILASSPCIHANDLILVGDTNCVRRAVEGGSPLLLKPFFCEGPPILQAFSCPASSQWLENLGGLLVHVP